MPCSDRRTSYSALRSFINRLTISSLSEHFRAPRNTEDGVVVVLICLADNGGAALARRSAPHRHSGIFLSKISTRLSSMQPCWQPLP